MKTFNEFLNESLDHPTSVQHKDEGTSDHTLVIKKKNSYPAILRKPHMDKLRNLGDGEETYFKDDKAVKWHAKRDNGEYHLNASSNPLNALKFSKSHIK